MDDLIGRTANRTENRIVPITRSVDVTIRVTNMTPDRSEGMDRDESRFRSVEWPVLKARLSNPVGRSSASSLFETESGLVRPRHGRCKLDLFLSCVFFSASTGFVLPYRRNEQLSARIGPALAEYWPTSNPL